MRIIAGQWRGRSLATPPGAATRPTADRVREALFSMLTSRLGSFEGLSVLDGFAGTGALALEALSRGAAQAWAIEQDAAALKVLKANVAALGAPVTIIAGPVASAPRAPHPCELVLLDPPYGQGLAAPALAHLAAQGWIAPHALVSVETAKGEALATGWEVLTERVFGKAMVRLLRAPG